MDNKKEIFLMGIALENIKIGQTCKLNPKTGDISLFEKGDKNVIKNR